MAIPKGKKRVPITLEKDVAKFISEYSKSQERTVSLQISFMIKELEKKVKEKEKTQKISPK